MKKIVLTLLATSLLSTSVFAKKITSCEKKIEKIVIALEKVNNNNKIEFADRFDIQIHNAEVKATAIVFGDESTIRYEVKAQMSTDRETCYIQSIEFSYAG